MESVANRLAASAEEVSQALDLARDIVKNKIGHLSLHADLCICEVAAMILSNQNYSEEPVEVETKEAASGETAPSIGTGAAPAPVETKETPTEAQGTAE